MRKIRKPMALRAMVFLSLLIGAFCLNACGNAVYEAVDTVQSDEKGTDTSSAESSDGSLTESTKTAASGGTESFGNESETDTGKRICVYVCGAVEVPGVYELSENARVYEAIEAAGGLRPDADRIHTNQAKVLSDGEQITVLTEEEAKNAPAVTKAAGGTGGSAEGSGSVMVNINTAGVSELTALNGIGESRAADIISYREEHGPFEKTEDIMKVTGIKTALYTKIKDHICV